MKALQVFLVVTLLALVALGAYLVATIQKNNELKKQNSEITAYFDDATKTIADIQSSLDNINPDMIKGITSNPEIPDSALVDRKGHVMNRIDQLNTQIQTYKTRLNDLQAKLNANGVKIRGLEQLVEKLKATITEKEELIAQLSTQLNEMSRTLESERETSKAEIAKRDETISQRDAALKTQEDLINTVYFIVGTQKDLMTRNVIEKTGGLLGIGSVPKMQKRIPLSQFTAMNLLNEQEISIPRPLKKVSLLSAQSQDSFELVPVNENLTKLIVRKPEVFRQNKYIVVLMK